MYQISLFKVVSGILVHLQGGKKKLRDQLNDTRADLAAKSQVAHQFGGSVLKKSNIGSTRYLGASKQFSNRTLGRSSHNSSMRSSVTPMTLAEKRKASLDSTCSSLKSRGSDEMRATNSIDALFHFPENLYPEYRQIPFFTILIIIVKATIISYIAHFIVFRTKEEGDAASSTVIPVANEKYAAFGNIFVANLFFGRHEKEGELFEIEDTDSIHNYFWMKCGLCVITTILLSILDIVLLQDFHFSPSRVTPDVLMKKKWFPSSLSRFSFVQSEIPIELNHDEGFDEKDTEIKMNNIGVHYLEYKNKSEKENLQDTISSDTPIDAIHFMHGFGANSMNWITTIKPIVHDLHAKVGIAHCGTGFGLTSRPEVRKKVKEDLAPYSSSGWAMVGNSLIIDRLNKDKRPEENLEANTKNKRVVLIGHSMGCAATLKMALTLPAFDKVVILVAPALVGQPPNVDKGPTSDSFECNQNVFRKILSSIKAKILQTLAFFHDAIIEPVLRYLLARGVGTSGFWQIGLQILGGYNPSEDHTLTFQWPGICHGWEKGILAFAKSRTLSVCPYAGGELELLDDVLMLPEVSLCIIHGTNDTLVPISLSRDIVKNALIDIDLIEMEGAGHLPMFQEEEKFIKIVKDCVEKLTIERY